MHFWKWTQWSAVLLAASGLLIPAPCLVAQSPTQSGALHSPQPLDVALEEGHVLRGHVVDNAGHPAFGVHLLLFQGQRLVASGQSDENGQFAIANVRGGSYQIAAGERLVLLRCWAPHTAPPTSVRSTLIQIADVERGQVHPAACVMANPWVIAGIAVAAIAIPAALKNNRDDRPAGSG